MEAARQGDIANKHLNGHGTEILADYLVCEYLYIRASGRFYFVGASSIRLLHWCVARFCRWHRWRPTRPCST